MIPPFQHATLSARFFQPLLATCSSPLTAPFLRSCPALPDAHWLLFGSLRALETFPSGRAFLQHLSSIHPDAPSRSLFFESLKSPRRLALSSAANHALCQQVDGSLSHRLAAFPDLAGWHLFAGDGHYHAAAAHDQRDPERERKFATGHFFGLNLRSHSLFHLTVADQLERKQEHDLRALKRLEIAALRRDAPKGHQVLWVWDRAALDFGFWRELKNRAGVYFLSRDKENTKLQTIGIREIDFADPQNDGVQRDEFVRSAGGVQLRRIHYFDTLSGESFVFVTNEFTLAPGLLAHLYRLRWNLEKVFDLLKNKLCEIKAWATSPIAKSAQAQFLCLTHNLLLQLEGALAEDDDIHNEAEIKRRAQRLQLAAANLKSAPPNTRAVKPSIPFPIAFTQCLTQRSVKFIRWLRSYLFSSLSWADLIAPLRRIYATS